MKLLKWSTSQASMPCGMPLRLYAMRPLPSINRHLLASIIVLTVLVVAACSAPDSEDQDKNWTSLSNLVETSDRIVVASFIESVVATTGSTGEPVDLAYSQFEVVESIKGTTDPEDKFWLGFDPARRSQLVNGSDTTTAFSTSKTYVLFMKGRLRPFEYPSEYGGDVLWTGNGQPALAELVGNDLIFLAESSYLQLLQAEEQPLPDQRSAAPFTATLNEVKDLVQ